MNEEIINKSKFNLSEFLKNNKTRIFYIIFLLSASIIIYIILLEYKKNKNTTISKEYNNAKILIEKNNNQEALIILEKIVFDENSFYSPSALNLIVDNNLINDKKKVLSYYDQVIFNSKLDIETKNLFIFKKVMFIGDSIKENDLISTLKPIIKSNSLWKNSMQDYIKKFYLAKGELNKAKEFEISKFDE